MFNIVRKTVQIDGKEVVIETGRIARQANGAVLISCGDTQLLVAVTAAKKPKPGQDFFPLSVDYIEKMYSAGRIPGGYIKRETRPSDREVLTSRLIDRPIRPLFPENFFVEVQVVATVMSYDPAIPSDWLAVLGASAALHISDVPFAGPVAAVRIGYHKSDKKFLINPNDDVMDKADLNLMVAGTKDGILMVEAAAQFVSEEVMLEAIELAHKQIQMMCKVQDELRGQVGVEKREVTGAVKNDAMEKALKTRFSKPLSEAYGIAKKLERREALGAVKAEARAALVPEGSEPGVSDDFDYLFEMACYNTLRWNILDRNVRVDGRKTTQIRPIVCETGVLRRPHGSALFTRGETQSIGVCTLGTTDDCQRSESLRNPLEEKLFMLQYNMPGYSVGEPKRLGSPGRREVGHGNLAERAVRAIVPPVLKFPYTIRLVSEITESNGSSSMASVCSGSLCLMDAGVPISEPVSGIAMGLIKEGEKFAILSDILGDEDALGDMDFKVAGGKSGITALQMDIKIGGLTMEILKQALAQAKEGRAHILGEMMKHISKPRDLSGRAPRVEQMKLKQERIRDLIGPGGKNIKSITAQTGCKVNVDDTGVVTIASADGKSAAAAKRLIQFLTSDPEIGDIYLGVVKKVADFGCFVEIKPGTEGLVHVSQLAAERVERVEDVIKEGEEVMVKVIEVDRTGRIKLSRKDAVGKTPSHKGV
jgi:polyribonucleotide nucleotidyltransferase